MVSYRMRVRQDTYLWGGASITHQLKSSLYLHFRVDDTGEALRFGIRKTNQAQPVEMGTLRPGECFTLHLQDIAGVWAAVADPLDTQVDCTIIGP